MGGLSCYFKESIDKGYFIKQIKELLREFGETMELI
jgi:hypothetical protein